MHAQNFAAVRHVALLAAPSWSVNVPLGKLEKQADDLPLERTEPVVAICLTAHRSIAAVRLLKRRGYDIVQLKGGMKAWRAAGLPEVKGPATPVR